MTAVAANGITIEYESLGDPAAPPILLIMGLGMQLVAWPDAFCQGLVDRGFRVIRFDNRDCGLSSKIRVRRQPNLVAALAAAWLRLPVRAPYTLDAMAADAVGLLDALGVAARARRRPVDGRHDRAGRRGDVAGPRAEPDVHHVVERQPQGLAATARCEAGAAEQARDPDDPESVVDHLVGVFGVIGSPDFPTDREVLREQVARNVRRGYHPAGMTRQLVAIIASGDRRKLLRKIAAPTLVIHGAEDPLVPVEAGRDTARHIAGAQLMVIEGMGHDLPPGSCRSWSRRSPRIATAASSPGDRCAAALRRPSRRWTPKRSFGAM